ncbi:MAG: autotransporter-associated beta strand repeat-containing protein [Caulobacteraceae bacterium]
MTIDNGAGQVSFGGARFAVGGYSLAGQALATTTAGAVVQVGDGMTATVGAPVTGSGGINKTDLGTLVLTGANTYAGATTVTAGVLQIGAGGTTGAWRAISSTTPP